jgi:hypothetical protein
MIERDNLILRKSKSSLGSYRDPLPLGWPLLVKRRTKSRPSSGRRSCPNSNKGNPTFIEGSNPIIPVRPNKSQEEVIHSQPGFRLVKSNNKISGTIDMTKFGENKNRKKNKNSENDFLQEEINRLGILLKAEQNAHQETKRLAASEMEIFRKNLEKENDEKIKNIIDEYTRNNLVQRDSFNTENIKQANEYLAKIEQLENEVKDSEVAFDIFQANSRDELESKVKIETKKLLDEAREQRQKLEETFEKRIRFRIQEERKSVEISYNDVILTIENKQKQEIEKLMEKLHGANQTTSALKDAETKAAGLNSRIEKHMMKISELEKENQILNKEIINCKIKIHDWEENYRRKTEQLIATHNVESERLLRENAQLRNRLVLKAETIGSMQYNNSKKISSFALSTLEEEKRKNSKTENIQNYEGTPISVDNLNDILKINRLDD